MSVISVRDGLVRIHVGDVMERLRALPDDFFDCVVTSPPYWGLRDYGVEGQIGLEPTLGQHLDAMLPVFDELRRVLKPTGTCWVNYGDCYASTPNGRKAADVRALRADDRTFRDKPMSTVGTGPLSGDLMSLPFRDLVNAIKPRDLCLSPSVLVLGLRAQGWFVRSEVIWAKKTPMPDTGGKSRPSVAFEKVFLLTKGRKNFYDHAAVSIRTSGNTHARSAKKAPGGWDSAPGTHTAIHRQGREGQKPGVTPKSADNNDRFVRAKASFHETTTEVLDTRYLRNYEAAPPDVWEVAAFPFADAHFATFPPELVARCIMAGCPADGHVLDPFAGSGTTGLVAAVMGRMATLIELKPEYAEIARKRIERNFMGPEERARDSARNGPPEPPGPLFGDAS